MVSKASAASPANRYLLVGVPSPCRTTGCRRWSNKLNLGIISTRRLATDLVIGCIGLALWILMRTVDIVTSHNDNGELETLLV